MDNQTMSPNLTEIIDEVVEKLRRERVSGNVKAATEVTGDIVEADKIIERKDEPEKE